MIETKIFRSTQWSQLKDRTNGHDIILTNGCFDILHPGHLIYLSHAASLSANMVVGLNSDESVKGLKGETRPINDFSYRAAMLAALPFVNYVVEFSDENPLELIRLLQPNILVKGGDYNLDEIVGREIVEENGGQVITLPFVGDYSTTDLIDRIKKS